MLVATPEYNSSIPGVLKNALDWASRPFPANALRDKPVLVIGASTGLFGAVWAQAETRKVLKTAGAAPLQDELPVIPVAWYRQSAVVSDRVAGVALDPLERSFRLADVEWAG